MSKTTKSGRTVKEPNRWSYANVTSKKRTNGKSLAKFGFYSKNTQALPLDPMSLPAIMRYKDSEEVINTTVREYGEEIDRQLNVIKSISKN